MATRIVFFALCLLPLWASAQISTDTKDYQTARQRLYIGTDTARYFTAIKTVLEAANTHKHVPTAKAVYDFIQTVLPVLTAGTGISITGTYPALTITNTGDLSATNELQDLSLSGQTLSLTSDASTVTLPIIGVAAGTGISVSTTTGTATVTNTGDTNASDDITTATTLGGDLNGTLPNPTVDGLQGRTVASTAPSTGEVLKWNGSAWAPGTDAGASMSGHTLKDDGTSMTARTGANFVSTSTVAAALTDDGAGDETEIRMSVPTDGITATEIAADAVGASEIAPDAVGSSEIATDAVGSAEIAANAVGTSELASTAVTAGTYTNATVTFDADGRATSASSGTAPATGTGTTNFITKWSGSSTLGNSLLYDDGTNVSIGSTSPSTKLDVIFSQSNQTTGFRIRNTNAGGWGSAMYMGAYGYASASPQAFDIVEFRTRYEGGTNGGKMAIVMKQQHESTAVETMTFRGNKVGIGKDVPDEVLDVVGNVRFSGAIMPGGSSGTTNQVLVSAGPGAAPTWADNWVFTSTEAQYQKSYASHNPTIRIGNTNTSGWSPTLAFDSYGYNSTPPAQYTLWELRPRYNGSSGSTFSFFGKMQAQIAAVETLKMYADGNASFLNGSLSVGIESTLARLLVKGAGSSSSTVTAAFNNSSGTQLLYILDDGTVGINTTTPSQKLDVNGNTRLRSALYDGTNSAGSSGNILSSTGSATQWITAAALVAAGNALTTATSFSGDVTGVYNNLQLGSAVVGATELASTAVTAGTYGSATQVPVITFDADGRATGVTNTTITSTDTHIGNTNLTLSGTRTLNFNNNTLEYQTGTGSFIVSTSSTSAIAQRWNIGQGAKLGVYDAAGSTQMNQWYHSAGAWYSESPNRSPWQKGLTTSGLIAADYISKEANFYVHKDRYVVFPDVTTLSGTGSNKFAWSATNTVYEYLKSGVKKTVANIEDDLQGTYNLYATHASLGFNEFYTEFDANTGAISVTVGGDMIEHRPYHVRCRRNGTNTITFEGDSGYTVAVDGDSTVSGDASIATGAGGTGIQAPYKIYTLTRVGTIIWFND